jgi:uroporphyrinogen decarboxylase
MRPSDRLRATYEFRPVDRLVRAEFGIWPEAIERWKKEGLPENYRELNLLNFDPPGAASVGLNLGWCEPPYMPAYEHKIVQDDGRTEIIQDMAGRWLRVFTGRRHGFMPDYIRHPVSSIKDWEEDVLPRLNPDDPRRYAKLWQDVARAAALARDEGRLVRQGFIGGYMFLRATIGPEEVLYAFHDQPELIHAMMRHWLKLLDRGLECVQAQIQLDEIAMGEDICYNRGLLISPDMVRQFLLPYYQEVFQRARRRQPGRRIHFFLDTDGWCEPAIPLYLEAGLTVLGPNEVASGCDVTKIGRDYPHLVLTGGLDKRVLAEGPAAIDRHLERIVPAMVKRGGYIPMCDHGVPDNVSLANYLHYRKRMCELDH